MGDWNTTFFHNFATQRKMKNTIKILEDGRGGWVEGDNAIIELAINIFKNLFSSNSLQSCERIRSEVHPYIIEPLNEELSKEFNKEVVEALKSMVPLKASGKYGHPVFFYKKF